MPQKLTVQERYAIVMAYVGNQTDEEWDKLIDAIVKTLPEEKAQSVHNRFKYLFGWEGTNFCRADVESFVDRAITDEEWARVVEQYEWRKGLPDRTTERGWQEVEDAISAAKLVRKGDEEGDDSNES